MYARQRCLKGLFRSFTKANIAKTKVGCYNAVYSGLLKDVSFIRPLGTLGTMGSHSATSFSFLNSGIVPFGIANSSMVLGAARLSTATADEGEGGVSACSDDGDEGESKVCKSSAVAETIMVNSSTCGKSKTTADMAPEFGFKYEGPEPTRYGDWAHKGRTSDF